MRKLTFKEKVKWRFRIDDDRMEQLEEQVADILRRLDELPPTPKQRKKK